VTVQNGEAVALCSEGTNFERLAQTGGGVATVATPQFWATGNGTADYTTALNNWSSYIVSSGLAGHLPAGTYKVSSALTWDLSCVVTKGIKITGDGVTTIYH
jgi:hypothetical protein